MEGMKGMGSSPVKASRHVGQGGDQQRQRGHGELAGCWHLPADRSPGGRRQLRGRLPDEISLAGRKGTPLAVFGVGSICAGLVEIRLCD